MTPKELACIHAEAMTVPAPWGEKDFADLFATPGIFLTLTPSSGQKYPGGSVRGAKPPSPLATAKAAQHLKGFALGRIILDEAELLTLAIDPAHQRQGLGRCTLAEFEATARDKGAGLAHLEVAATNQAARTLYDSAGWTQTGTRPAYYKAHPSRIDAILMSKRLDTP